MAKLLVVDDDPQVKDLIVMMLEGAGHAVEGAESGTEALDQMAKAAYDLVILDRNLGDMTGLEVLSAARKRFGAKSPKVIMCTAADMVGDAADAFASGAVDFIVKPIDFKRLAEKIAKHAPPA